MVQGIAVVLVQRTVAVLAQRIGAVLVQGTDVVLAQCIVQLGCVVWVLQSLGAAA